MLIVGFFALFLLGLFWATLIDNEIRESKQESPFDY